MPRSVVSRIEDPSNDNLEEIVDLLAYTNTDQWVNSMVGGDQTLLPEMFRAMVRAALLDGEVHVVEDGIDETGRAEVCSVGRWFGTYRKCWDTEAQRALGFDKFLGHVSPRSKKSLKEVYSFSYNELFYQVLRKEKEGSCWAMAMDAIHGQKGFGRAIVDTMYQKAIADNMVITGGTSGQEYVRLRIGLTDTQPANSL
ncbi:hypothetical protein HETIRDRAFT_106263 [Heterobasidion irregulare TC 32-1]|uniref:Acyl-CoA N-acyltransferase n=1 Tax=Heterobasidion irregulare (strain TC 32-1) TaxID=747525 RepID=W4JTJ9_HETIT|nr:uncharacterized protein HETIRDRAFT_106263 [Heterobasidion irregulare TC 32-1]ETW76882.1 hypothetical protein HETIRDRAFT_106263 [Heterobasidion irregulare TC 32-1]